MKILFIDDDPSRWNLIKTGTNIPDSDVYFAHGFDQIKQYLHSSIKWDFVLLDGDMPLMDGMDVCREFTYRISGAKVLIISANPVKNEQMFDFLFENGIDVFRSPITNPTLIRNRLRG